MNHRKYREALEIIQAVIDGYNTGITIVKKLNYRRLVLSNGGPLKFTSQSSDRDHVVREKGKYSASGNFSYISDYKLAFSKTGLTLVDLVEAWQDHDSFEKAFDLVTAHQSFLDLIQTKKDENPNKASDHRLHKSRDLTELAGALAYDPKVYLFANNSDNRIAIGHCWHTKQLAFGYVSLNDPEIHEHIFGISLSGSLNQVQSYTIEGIPNYKTVRDLVKQVCLETALFHYKTLMPQEHWKEHWTPTPEIRNPCGEIVLTDPFPKSSVRRVLILES